MKKNIGNAERVVRVLIGLGILSLLVFLDGNARYWGLIGLMPLLTGLSGWCPPYQLFGFDTCKAEGEGNA